MLNSLTKRPLTVLCHLMIKNLFCYPGWKLLAGVGSTKVGEGGREVQMALQPSCKHIIGHFISFCIIQMASFGRLNSLPEWDFVSLVLKKTVQDGIFARKVLKTKYSVHVRWGLHIFFFIFLLVIITLLRILTCLEVFFLPKPPGLELTM